MKILLITLFTILLVTSHRSLAQVSELSNTFPGLTSFLGWNNIGPSADLNFRTNNVQRMTLTQTNGRLGLGLLTPTSHLHISTFNHFSANGNIFRTDGDYDVVNRWQLFTGLGAAAPSNKFTLWTNAVQKPWINLTAERASQGFEFWTSGTEMQY